MKGLNRILQGFKNYYSISPIAKKWLNKVDWYVLGRNTVTGTASGQNQGICVSGMDTKRVIAKYIFVSLHWYSSVLTNVFFTKEGFVEEISPRLTGNCIFNK
ncbi:group II intron maturase-specific domain-containing protein [Peribacillus tepidiphilus]|uniref:group II intron maturase-specific domain-containing protein n=1 Tax=Peribacillus tepidiphilus TaxID=2652445 RepID=UPI0021F08FB9|nr:group II intron maturase-specific domain-containing protein [Peribacillus tepidiphilus]